MKKNDYIIGLILIVAGCITLANNIFSMKNMWPAFVLGLGLIFEISYFTCRKNPGLLVPGGILITIGLLFFFEVFTGWRFSEYTWPVYILAPAIGLFQLYLFMGRQKGLLISVLILASVSGFSFLMMLSKNFLYWIDLNMVIGSLFVIAGIYVLFRNKTQ